MVCFSKPKRKSKETHLQNEKMPPKAYFINPPASRPADPVLANEREARSKLKSLATCGNLLGRLGQTQPMLESVLVSDSTPVSQHLCLVVSLRRCLQLCHPLGGHLGVQAVRERTKRFIKRRSSACPAAAGGERR